MILVPGSMPKIILSLAILAEFIGFRRFVRTIMINTVSNKQFYKVISLLLKAGIFILSVWYIFQKLTNSNFTLNLEEAKTKIDSPFFFIALLLVLINWGIEAGKWKYLISKLEYISFSTAFKSILSGVTISIFTPNRVGEFAGRVFYLKNADKIKATIVSLIGSMLQLSVTILAGAAACIFYYFRHEDESDLLNFMAVSNLLFLGIIITVVLLVIVFVYAIRNVLSERIKHVFVLYTSKEILNAFTFSLLRYFVFSFQYYLILRMFGINAGLIDSFLLIAITFFITSVIPTFALTEITVRGASSVYFFSTVSNDSTAIIAASIVVWIINLAIPALIGGAFIWNLKFFED